MENQFLRVHVQLVPHPGWNVAVNVGTCVWPDIYVVAARNLGVLYGAVYVIEHLNFAIAEFRDMKMQPSLERALRRKDILKA